MSEETKNARALLFVFLFCTQLFAVPAFYLGFKGPHGGPLIRAASKGPYIGLSPDDHRLYFELKKGRGEFSLYPYLLVSQEKNLGRAVVPATVLREYVVTARAPLSGRDLRLEAVDDDAVRVVFTSLEAMQLGIKFGDPLVINIAVIHDSVSKEAAFETYYLAPQ